MIQWHLDAAASRVLALRRQGKALSYIARDLRVPFDQARRLVEYAERQLNCSDSSAAEPVTAGRTAHASA